LLVTVIAKVALSLDPSLIVVENVPAFLTRRVKHPKDGRPISAANYLITALSKRYLMFPLVADLGAFGIPQSRTRSFLTFVRRDLPGCRDLIKFARAPFPRMKREGDRITLREALLSFGLPSLDASSPERAAAPGFDGLHTVPIWSETTYAMVRAIPPHSGKSAWENDECRHCGTVDVSRSDARCPRCGEALLRPVVREKDGGLRLVKGFSTSYRRMPSNRPATTITTASGHIGSDYTIHPFENRLLSPLECALLQTFPRGFMWGEALRTVGHTNVREMIGEAVPPAFTRLHGEVLLGILRKKWTRAPISSHDESVTRAWLRLIAAADEDGRQDPQTYVSYIPLRLKPKRKERVAAPIEFDAAR
jgi:DNA (cytosine-5)-methyltransferase 1